MLSAASPHMHPEHLHSAIANTRLHFLRSQRHKRTQHTPHTAGSRLTWTLQVFGGRGRGAEDTVDSGRERLAARSRQARHADASIHWHVHVVLDTQSFDLPRLQSRVGEHTAL